MCYFCMLWFDQVKVLVNELLAPSLAVINHQLQAKIQRKCMDTR